MNKIIFILSFNFIFFSCDSTKNKQSEYVENTFKIYDNIIKEKKITRINNEPKFIDKVSLSYKEINQIFTVVSFKKGFDESKKIDQREINTYWKLNTNIIYNESIKVLKKSQIELNEKTAYYEISNPIFDSNKKNAIIEIAYQCGKYCSYHELGIYSNESGIWRKKSNIYKTTW